MAFSNMMSVCELCLNRLSLFDLGLSTKQLFVDDDTEKNYILFYR